MPRKPKPVAGPPAARPWTAEELAIVKRKFPTTTNRALAEMLGRTVKSVIYCGAQLALKKSPKHRSAQSKRTAKATHSKEHMAAIGSLGGQKGGVARAEAMTATQRSEAARQAIAARWAKPKSKKS